MTTDLEGPDARAFELIRDRLERSLPTNPETLRSLLEELGTHWGDETCRDMVEAAQFAQWRILVAAHDLTPQIRNGQTPDSELLRALRLADEVYHVIEAHIYSFGWMDPITAIPAEHLTN